MIIVEESEISKADIFKIIKSNDLETIRSLKDKESLKKLEFSDQEKDRLLLHLM